MQARPPRQPTSRRRPQRLPPTRSTRSGRAELRPKDSFAALAKEKSKDTGSAADGGLISGITSSANYVESFRNWATDSSRKVGDTGIVESEYGYHIMYYSGQ